MGTYMGGLSVWHTPSPLKCGGPLPRIPPLTDTMTGVKKGVNPLNLDKSFLFEKPPLYINKIFWEKFEKSQNTPHILKINFLEKFGYL